VDGLASLFRNFEIALNRSLEIAKKFEDAEMIFYSSLIWKQRNWLLLWNVKLSRKRRGLYSNEIDFARRQSELSFS
jgi:hypothetical protein